MSLPGTDVSSGIDAAPRRWPSSLSIVVLLAGLLVTGLLTSVTESIHNHNESRLLSIELNQAGSVVAAAVPSIQIPLTSAAELATATNGSPSQFRAYMQSYTGGNPFASASLWRLGSGPPTEVAAVGLPAELGTTSGAVTAFLPQARHTPPMAVLNLLNQSRPGIGYASAAASPSSPWVVYAERILPADRKLNVTRNSAFSQLNYALYLGKTATNANLLEASATHFPLVGQRASVTVPFGNSAITLVATANGELGGSLLQRLPLIIALVGAVLAIAAAFMANYLVRRRRQAEWLASENRRMYSEQRSIADVLQHALLPQSLPQIPGVELAFRYVAGGEGTDVGGDWYDVIPIDDNRFLFVLGDVSGRGVEAATIMARLHFAIRAYAIQGDEPQVILAKLGRLLSIELDKSFATVLCGVVDVADHVITLVNAGHPPILLLSGTTGHFLATNIYPPVGVEDATQYEPVQLDIPAGATIVAFTDGLVERRGETIDAGLERLRALSTERPLALDDLLTKILTESTAAEYHDDTAILAVRWTS
jgi:serine phosphatase RsbU (regulator of sigma subunit)